MTHFSSYYDDDGYDQTSLRYARRHTMPLGWPRNFRECRCEGGTVEKLGEHIGFSDTLTRWYVCKACGHQFIWQLEG